MVKVVYLFSLLCKHLQVCLIILKGAGFLTSNPIGGKGFHEQLVLSQQGYSLLLLVKGTGF
jgi:hypothetical protein